MDTLARPCAVVFCVLACFPAATQGNPLRFDFETGDLQGWRIVEGQFDEVVCGKATGRNAPGDLNKQGRYFLSSIERPGGRGDDSMTGIIESPAFWLDGPQVTFRVGGGNHPDTYVALVTCDDDLEVLRAGGPVSEFMVPVEWDATAYVGRLVCIRVVDHNRGGWGHITLDDVSATGRIDAEATAQRDRDRLQARAQEAVRIIAGPLALAIADLRDTFGPRYPGASAYLARLAELTASLGGAAAPARIEECLAALRQLQREALIANPLVSEAPLLFVTRAQYLPDHHNTETLFQTGEINTASFRGGGALRTIDLRTGETRTLVEAPQGIVRDPDVRFDGARIVFSMRQNAADDYHIYEVGMDGSRLAQLTFGRGLSDLDPLYLPDGRIAFSSTREPKYCMCNRHVMANLFRMEPDGASIEQIGKSTLFEGHGSLTPDGRILYDRWEYVDRNFGDAQGLWVCNPDGTEHVLYWGNNTPSPGAVLEGRVIPGTQRVVATFSSCHDRPWGALAIVDRRLGMDGRAPVVRTWPPSAIELVMQGDFDRFTAVNPKYEDPYPLSERYFLCSRMTGEGERMGLYLVDVFGNEVLLHVEGQGCFDPMPLSPRERPPVVPDRIDLRGAMGYAYVDDVYRGTGMDAVHRGTVRWLRVVESPEKRFWTQDAWLGQGQEAPAMNWHDFNNKRILGTVPVDEDGSAYFEVPADRFVYFQLLDERGMMVQSMRSGTTFRPGEATGCIGCHEDRGATVPSMRPRTAFHRAPSKLEPWHGTPREFSYITEVQPVFDRYCVSCHDMDQPAGQKLCLAGDRGLAFNRSYNEIWRKGYVHVVGAGPAEVQEPLTWGSHASRLVQVLLAGHHGVSLDAESFDRLVTWIDLNAPYYPTYATGYPRGAFGRSPLSNDELTRLGALTGINFLDHVGDQEEEILVSFDRPDMSPVLAAMGDKDAEAYAEALALIEAGAKRLAETDRGDRPTFVLAGIEADRQAKYAERQETAARTRQAMLRGERYYPYRDQAAGR
ncbi:MAG TPA: hypothetical protein PLD23_19680 [Armatimonadota bacterium]|nr:hypothetical protein [Armatimonadota bacterium]